ncbi:hypothetical protein [Sphaerisporangium sp. NPDC051011]|uniref:hypothetical protein n=1 Tax=Sphaerisporangium sp. NPDC051011 TaxID=3155792 RepID=UPI0033F33B0C
MKLTRSLMSAVSALLFCVALPLATTQPASASTSACGGAVSGSYRWDGTISTHVRGSGCTTRWAHLTVSGNASCCSAFWVKIERQLWGSYGWLTTHKQSRRNAWNSYIESDTSSVPWSPQDGDQRFHACWAWGGDSEPSSWLCGPWVS